MKLRFLLIRYRSFFLKQCGEALALAVFVSCITIVTNCIVIVHFLKSLRTPYFIGVYEMCLREIPYVSA
jgi:hypothetical protein